MATISGTKSVEKLAQPASAEREKPTPATTQSQGPDLGLQRLARHAAARAGAHGPGDDGGPHAAMLSAGRMTHLQRSVGNAAVARYLAAGETPVVQRLFGARQVDTSELSDMEALRLHREERGRGPMGSGKLGWLRGGLREEDHEAIEGHIDEEELDEEAPSPFENHRDLVPTTKDVGAEVGKPAGLLAASGAGYLGGSVAHTAPGAASQSLSTGGGIGGEIFGSGLLLDSALTLLSGHKQREAATKRGDHAGRRLGSRKIGAGGMALGAGSIGVAAGGLKLGSAFGSSAAGLTQAAGGLGVLGGAVGMGQGLWRMNAARKRFAAAGRITPATADGQRWKSHVRSQELGRGAVNAAKFAAGGFAAAAGGLLAAGMGDMGFKVGLAGAVLGGVLALGKIGSKISDMWKQRQAKREVEKSGGVDHLLAEQTPAQQARDPGRRNEVHGQSDKMQASHSPNAKIAGEIIAAMRGGRMRLVAEARQVRKQLSLTSDHTFTRVNEYWTKKARPKSRQVGAPELKLHDAWSILTALNVSPEEAKSESGQDLIQRKLSVAESV
ncbi:MAG: hypothetical protein JWO62_3412 [Acidimicrobiaceae bacterium]|nr:hypothetical protein [Acidimicrobiaceae bacterium]